MALTPALVEQAARNLAPHLPPTPLQHSRAFSVKAGCQVYLKIESVQPVRAFKVRGALNRILNLDRSERAAGVLTASAGNHGLGVAFGAQLHAIPATVFVPEGANQLKVEAIRRLGARVVTAGRSYAEASAEALAAQAASGATFIPAFDDPHVIAGQGTVALEVVRQLPDFDSILVPVGGGGLIAGIALYLKALRPAVRVIGVEPAGADGLARALEAGRIVPLERVSTMADGLAAAAPGRLNFEIARESVDSMIRVREEELLRAIGLCFEWEHLLAEPAGAAGIAALLYHHRPDPGERVVVVLSGANITDEVMLRALRSR